MQTHFLFLSLFHSFSVSFIHLPAFFPRTEQQLEMGKFYRIDWIWDIHTNHKETNVCFRLSPAPAKCLNPMDLPSEWWICVPLRQLIQSSFLSHLFQHEPLNSSQTPPFNRTDTHLLSFMGSPCNCFSSHSGECRQSRELVPGGGLFARTTAIFLLCPLELWHAGLHHLWQDSPWKPKLRPRSPSALSALLFPSPGAPQRVFAKRVIALHESVEAEGEC